MKFIYKQLAVMCLLVVFITSILPLSVFADGSEALLDCNFEQEGDLVSWSGAIRDSNCAYEGEYGIQVVNPYGDESVGMHGHILSYNDYIQLEEGNFYTFSAYVMNPFSDDLSNPTASAYIGRNGSELFIDVSGVGFDWTLVTASFMATESTTSTLTLTLEGGDIDFGFFVDSVSIIPETRVPAYGVLEGPQSVAIPQNGYSDYRYSLVVYDTDGVPVNILVSDLDLTIDSLPDGVEFDETTGYLRVHSYAEADMTFSITCNTSAGIDLSESSITITTTKNLLSDPGFENGEENWVSEDELLYTDSMISLFASKEGDYGRYATVSYSKQLLLFAGQMYVFRADVGSSEEFASSSVYISNLSFAQSGYAEINITGVGGEWSRVTSAFLIEDTGLYDLTINLYAPTERPVFMDNVYLGVEDEAPTSISVRAPGNIQVPSEIIILPCYADVHNQLGDIMDGLVPQMTISPQKDGVYLSNGEIIVEHNAKSGDYTIEAVYGDIVQTHTITVSDNAIGDGGFEEKQANEWWTSSDGSVFSIIDYDSDKAGHVYSPESSCIVINNSYLELIGGEYYVYSAQAGFGEGVVTAFIADAYTGEYIPFAQYDPLVDTLIPFSVDSSVIGRLVLYIESDESVGLLFDDISIIPAELTATDISVSGGEYGEFLRGSYNYINNMSLSPEADISATRWYISPTYDGHYEPIGIPNQNYLEITEDMIGQYILFEVTPVCADTGVVADSVRSLPVLIASEETVTPDNSERPLSVMTPIELNNTDTHPFMDITSHWAEDVIASLSESGIVSGKSYNRFYPEHYITRAEFTAMVARAFSLVSLPYSGQFDDVNASDWYAGWVEACYKRGIITGVDSTTFAPDECITREQMAVILYRAYLLAEGPMPYELDLRYYDSFLISDWAYDSVKHCTNLNIFTGNEMNLFKPGDWATRAEAAACLHRTLKCF